jgi:hypothetical protein
MLSGDEEGSWIVVSLNSRFESDKEGEEVIRV